MKNNEIYLLTAFVTSACDGEIAPEEIKLLHDFSKNTSLFEGLDVEVKLNNYIEQINKNGKAFINDFLSVLSSIDLSDQEQLNIIDVSMQMIEADNKIVYSEIKFFKKLRNSLTIPDEKILEKMPELEDYLQPDILIPEFDFDMTNNFSSIDLSQFNKKE